MNKNEKEIDDKKKKWEKYSYYKNKRLIQKISLIITILILNTFNFMNAVNANNIDTAYMQVIGDCGQLLTYNGVPVKVTYIAYTKDGVEYPAYCMDKTKSRR